MRELVICEDGRWIKLMGKCAHADLMCFKNVDEELLNGMNGILTRINANKE